MINVKETVISQYANSPVLTAVIQLLNDCLDPRADIHNFYETVWDVHTATGFGLDTWGAIVGIDREVYLDAEDEFIGFSDGMTPFNQGSWAVDESTSRKYRIDDETYRKVIMLKAMSNIIYATAPNINTLLRAMFGKRGRAYYVKNGTMRARYVFEFYLLPLERAIIRKTDLLPRPTGVFLDFYEFGSDKMFGFTESSLTPFGEGVFFMGA